MKRIAAGAFAAALLCFLLPFFHITCAGNKVLTVSGVTLVAGGEASVGSDLKKLAAMGRETGGAQAKGGDEPKVDPEPLAILAAIAALAGLVLCLVPGKPGPTGGIAAGACAIVLLFALMWKVDADVKRDAKKERAKAPVTARPEAEATMPPGFERAMGQQIQGMVKVEAASGFMLAVGLLLVATALSAAALYQLRRSPAAGTLSG